MDATIAAALITGAVGAVGIVGTVVASTASTRATLAAAREHRLWERRAVAYEEFLTALLIRQAKRRYGLREDVLDETAVDRLETIYDDSDPLGPPETQARLAAYASDAVLEAFRFAGQAHIQVLAQYQQYRWTVITSKKQAAQTRGMADGFKEIVAARRAVDLPAKEAEAADQALIKVIRQELGSKPEATTLPATVPAKRRRFRRRIS